MSTFARTVNQRASNCYWQGLGKFKRHPINLETQPQRPAGQAGGKPQTSQPGWKEPRLETEEEPPSVRSLGFPGVFLICNTCSLTLTDTGTHAHTHSYTHTQHTHTHSHICSHSYTLHIHSHDPIPSHTHTHSHIRHTHTHTQDTHPHILTHFHTPSHTLTHTQDTHSLTHTLTFT